MEWLVFLVGLTGACLLLGRLLEWLDAKTERLKEKNRKRRLENDRLELELGTLRSEVGALG